MVGGVEWETDPIVFGELNNEQIESSNLKLQEISGKFNMSLEVLMKRCAAIVS
jgi:hypothetical protein